MNHILIENITIEVVRKKVKYMRLSVHAPDAMVRVTASNSVKEESIKSFIISKLSWIKKQQKKMEGLEIVPKLKLISGEFHFLFDNKYLLNVIEGKSNLVILNDSIIELHCKPKTILKKRKIILEEWYREELIKKIPFYIHKWEKEMNVSVNEFRIKKMKTRWGTCNIKDKRIWINLELAKRPLHCLEYLVVHEMVHLLERSHNKRFTNFMNNFLPNWKLLRKELNRKSP
jgi:predicted metal-dependent hydrolase